jgi:hypothetical protein
LFARFPRHDCKTSIGVESGNRGCEVAKVPVTEEYGAAAVRHFADAEILAARKRWVGAGHLVGFAAECAIKHRIETLRPEQGAPHGHFPEILNAARRHISKRRDTTIHAFLKMTNLMEGWDISLRYSRNEAVDEAKYRLWRDHAARLVSAAGLRRSN